ncbi:EXOS1-like protein [Mya arenaria]|uniref:EXOS1-like protein n=1 Tax=Mya arenaria TaxID=6604 RepID=A0ABY7FM33_MYAAR|nr:EXOS1-like protein [Mya arenaria]
MESGQRLCREEVNISAGRGTYTRNGFIYSSLAGALLTSTSDDSKKVVEVLRGADENIVPTVDALVTAKVEMSKSFRPGDIVISRVISLGDSQSYLLTTAENELGVVIATSEAGASMVPVSWSKMRCPLTLQEEHRKVAKVQPRFIEATGT